MATDQQTIEAQFRDGTLLASIERGAPESAVLGEICVELHNSGRIDLIALVEQGAHERLSRQLLSSDALLLQGYPASRRGSG